MVEPYYILWRDGMTWCDGFAGMWFDMRDGMTWCGGHVVMKCSDVTTLVIMGEGHFLVACEHSP